MKIKFSWGTGWMEVNAEHVIEHMSMTIFRKWVKLFAQYGTAEQHKEFLQFVVPYIGMQEAKCAEKAEELHEMQMKADGELPTVLGAEYLQKQVKLLQGRFNGANSTLKRYKTIYSTVEGLMS